MRTIDEAALSEAAAARFRSEYDYAVFEYRRSAKVLQALDIDRMVQQGSQSMTPYGGAAVRQPGLDER